MRITKTLATLLCAATVAAHAQSAAHNTLLSQFKASKSEPTAKDATWTSANMFKVGVLDNGTNRDGYATYVCGEAAAIGLKSITVQVIDIAKLKATGKWVKLGEKRCS